VEIRKKVKPKGGRERFQVERALADWDAWLLPTRAIAEASQA